MHTLVPALWRQRQACFGEFKDYMVSSRPARAIGRPYLKRWGLEDETLSWEFLSWHSTGSVWVPGTEPVEDEAAELAPAGCLGTGQHGLHFCCQVGAGGWVRVIQRS